MNFLLIESIFRRKDIFEKKEKKEPSHKKLNNNSVCTVFESSLAWSHRR